MSMYEIINIGVNSFKLQVQLQSNLIDSGLRWYDNCRPKIVVCKYPILYVNVYFFEDMTMVSKLSKLWPDPYFILDLTLCVCQSTSISLHLAVVIVLHYHLSISYHLVLYSTEYRQYKSAYCASCLWYVLFWFFDVPFFYNTVWPVCNSVSIFIRFWLPKIFLLKLGHLEWSLKESSKPFCG